MDLVGERGRHEHADDRPEPEQQDRGGRPYRGGRRIGRVAGDQGQVVAGGAVVGELTPGASFGASALVTPRAASIERPVACSARP